MTDARAARRARRKEEARKTDPMERPIEIVHRRAYERSADFIEANGANALLFGRKPHLHQLVARSIPEGGLLMECGVFKGASINRMAKMLPDRTIHGFDSFEGLSEDWIGLDHQKGHFDLGGVLPAVEPNVKLYKGWVDDTLPPFLAENAGPISYLHVDTDTYSPAKTILTLCRERLIPGSIVLFDELFGYPNWEVGEYKALMETIPEDCYEFIGFSQMEAAMRIVKAPG